MVTNMEENTCEKYHMCVFFRDHEHLRLMRDWLLKPADAQLCTSFISQELK